MRADGSKTSIYAASRTTSSLAPLRMTSDSTCAEAPYGSKEANLRKLRVAVVLSCLLMSYSASAQRMSMNMDGTTVGTDSFGFPTAPPADVTRTAVRSGGWSEVATWSGGTVPIANDIVDIPAGVTVTLSGDTAHVRWVQVEGTLALSSAASSHMYVETLFIAQTGAFTLFPALPSSYTAQVTFTSSGPFDHLKDPNEMTRGLVAEGHVQIVGEQKLSVATVSADLRHGSNGVMSKITIDQNPNNWHPHDLIVLTGTYFRRYQPMQDELLSINSFDFSNPKIITIDQTLQNDHLRVPLGTGFTQLHVANLTRNVTFSSEQTPNSTNSDRGHVMLTNEHTDIENVAFVNLGRTDKSQPLDDYVVTDTALAPSLATINNRRGRYAVHVHMTRMNPDFNGWNPLPAAPPTMIKGCVVNGTSGWGFVNHSSYVDFTNDVAYNFTGAGFVTEGGDELGNFVNDVAIRGNGQIGTGGDGQYRKVRLNFANVKRPQPLSDTAFNGEGFWFAGPALYVDGLVANSCNGTGVIWHTTGTVDVKMGSTTGHLYGRYVGFPQKWMTPVWGATTLSGLTPRTFSYTAGNDVLVVPTDLPILHCSNIQAYGDFVGFRLRFVNHDALSWYNESQIAGERYYGYDKDITPGADPSRKQQTVSNLTLWNNEAAITVRYVKNTKFTNVKAVSRLDYDEKTPANPLGLSPNYGVESFFKVETMDWDLTTDGYELAQWTGDGTDSSISDHFTFKSALNYVKDGLWKGVNSACSGPAPTPTLKQNNPRSVTLNWTHAGTSTKQLIRYRAVGDQQWLFTPALAAGANTYTITGLTPSRTYQAQLTYACADGLSQWATAPTFKQAECTAPGITTQPASVAIQSGSLATLTVVPSGSGPFSYQWYQGNKGTTTMAVGTDSDTFSVSPPIVTNYWVRVTSTCDYTYFDSETATVAVYDYTPAPIARVQAASNAVVSQSSISANWTQATAAGDLLVASISASNVSLIGTFTPPSGWLLAKRYDWNNISTAIYYMPNAPGGRASETFATQNFPDLTLQLAEYSGMAAASVLDTTAFDGDNAPRSGIVSSGNAGPTSQARELVFAALTTYAQTAFTYPTGTFNELSDRAIGWNLTTATYDSIVSNTGTYGVSATAGGTAQWVGVVVTFKGAS